MRLFFCLAERSSGDAGPARRSAGGRRDFRNDRGGDQGRGVDRHEAVVPPRNRRRSPRRALRGRAGAGRRRRSERRRSSSAARTASNRRRGRGWPRSRVGKRRGTPHRRSAQSLGRKDEPSCVMPLMISFAGRVGIGHGDRRSAIDGGVDGELVGEGWAAGASESGDLEAAPIIAAVERARTRRVSRWTRWVRTDGRRDDGRDVGAGCVHSGARACSRIATSA